MLGFIYIKENVVPMDVIQCQPLCGPKWDCLELHHISWKDPIGFINNNLTGICYRNDIIGHHIPPFVKSLEHNILSQKDNTRSVAYCHQLNMSGMKWNLSLRLESAGKSCPVAQALFRYGIYHKHFSPPPGVDMWCHSSYITKSPYTPTMIMLDYTMLYLESAKHNHI